MSKKHDKTALRMQKLQEKQLLDAIHAIFNKSDLLKGQTPSDKIVLPKPCLALLENLSLLDRAEARISKTPSKKSTIKKSSTKKGRKS